MSIRSATSRHPIFSSIRTKTELRHRKANGASLLKTSAQCIISMQDEILATRACVSAPIFCFYEVDSNFYIHKHYVGFYSKVQGIAGHNKLSQTLMFVVMGYIILPNNT